MTEEADACSGRTSPSEFGPTTCFDPYNDISINIYWENGDSNSFDQWTFSVFHSKLTVTCLML